MWGARANASLIDWTDNDKEVAIVGEHDGYARLADPVMHRRSLTLEKTSGKVSILDQLDCSGRHEARVCFHIAPGCDVSQDGDAVLIVTGSRKLRLTASCGQFDVVAAGDDGKAGWSSTGYHRKARGHAIFLKAAVDGSTQIRTTIEFDAS